MPFLTLIMKPSVTEEAPDWCLFPTWEEGRDHLIGEINLLAGADEVQRAVAVSKLQSAPAGANRSVYVGSFMFGIRREDE